MALTRAELFDEAMQLNLADREWIVEQLSLNSDGDTRDEVDAAQLAAARRRHAEYLAGRDIASPVEEALARVVGRVRR